MRDLPVRSNLVLVVLAAAAAAAYFVIARLGAGGWVALKLAAILPLAAVAWRERTAGGAPLALALAVHATGDLLIEVAPLPLAMGSFGLGHLLYARLFAGARGPWEEAGAGAKVRIGSLALVGAGLLAWLGPALAPPFTVAVPVYALLLLAMAALAQLARRGAPWVAVGALLYVVSDSLLSLDLFTGPLPWTKWFVWPTYWAGQAAIALGWLGGGAVGWRRRAS